MKNPVLDSDKDRFRNLSVEDSLGQKRCHCVAEDDSDSLDYQGAYEDQTASVGLIYDSDSKLLTSQFKH